MKSPQPTVAVGNPNVLKLGRTLVQKLSICLRTTRLYEGPNVTVREAAQELVETIRTIHNIDGDAQLALVLDYLTLNDSRLKTDLAGHATFKYLVDGFTARGMGAVTFQREVTPDEAIRFCNEFHRVRTEDEDSDPFGELNEGLRRAGVRAITIDETMGVAQSFGDENLKKDVKRRSIKLFFQSISLSRQILEATDPRKMNFKKAKRVIQQMVDAITEEDFVLLSLTSIKNYDQYTFNHSANVAVYSIAFGQKLGLERQALADLGMAGLFHDLGKTQVPKEILNKPARLEGDEWEKMKNHSVYGAEMLLKSRQLTDSAIRNILVAFEHHLNLDHGPAGSEPLQQDRRGRGLLRRPHHPPRLPEYQLLPAGGAQHHDGGPRHPLRPDAAEDLRQHGRHPPDRHARGAPIRRHGRRLPHEPVSRQHRAPLREALRRLEGRPDRGARPGPEREGRRRGIRARDRPDGRPGRLLREHRGVPGHSLGNVQVLLDRFAGRRRLRRHLHAYVYGGIRIPPRPAMGPAPNF